MKIVTWEEILNKNPDKLKIIGYGSLLNSNTHHNNHECLPVLVNGVKRIYNIKVLEDSSSEEFYDQMFIYHQKNYGIKSREEFDSNIGKNHCALNCIPGYENDKVNGLIFEIDRDHLYKYSVREADYNLIEVDFNYIDNLCNIQKSGGSAYILMSKDQYVLKDEGIPFEPYHNNTRTGAYNISKEFGELFDETTFDVNGDRIN